MPVEVQSEVNLDHLLKLRLVVARHGEMDRARWWNTKGMLGPNGAIVLQRGFPRTHSFAQARVVFAVARHRCAEVFNPPGCATLWSLPAELEERFEEAWQRWLDEEGWAGFFEGLKSPKSLDLLAELEERGLLTPEQKAEVGRLKTTAEGKAVQLRGVGAPDTEALTLLAAAFALGEPGSPAIPYLRLA